VSLQRSDSDDAALLRAVADGDEQALAALHDRHAGWLLARLRRRCSSAALPWLGLAAELAAWCLLALAAAAVVARTRWQDLGGVLAALSALAGLAILGLAPLHMLPTAFVAQMTAAATAEHLGTAHEHAVITSQRDGRRGETRPARAGLEPGIRAEQLAAAARAPVTAVAVLVHVIAGERPLGAALAQDAVLLRRQLFAPLLIGLADLRCQPAAALARDMRIRVTPSCCPVPAVPSPAMLSTAVRRPETRREKLRCP